MSVHLPVTRKKEEIMNLAKEKEKNENSLSMFVLLGKHRERAAASFDGVWRAFWAQRHTHSPTLAAKESHLLFSSGCVFLSHMHWFFSSSTLFVRSFQRVFSAFLAQSLAYRKTIILALARTRRGFFLLGCD